MKKGFTLIELLAVIVILAIIALIATPIILGIINDTRDSSNERSVELYADALKNGIAAYQLREKKAVSAGTYTSREGNIEEKQLPFKVEYEGNVECDKIEIYEDGRVYVEDCTVNGGDKKYNYGPTTEGVQPPEETPSTQVYKPQYYYFGLYGFTGTVGLSDAPVESERLTVPPTGEIRYLGYDVIDGKVSTAYACFTRNETEYCLKGTTDGSSYETNVEIIKDAYADVVDTDACSFTYNNIQCGADGVYAIAYSLGGVNTYDDYYYLFCIVNYNGDFECRD